MSVDPKKIKLPKGATLIQDEKPEEAANIVLPPGATLITDVKKKDDSQAGANNLPLPSKNTPPYIAAPAKQTELFDPTFKKNWLDPTLFTGEPDPTPKILFSDYDKKELGDLQTKYKVSTEDPRQRIREAAGINFPDRPTVSKRPFVDEYKNVTAVENRIKTELEKINTAHKMMRPGTPNPYKDEQKALEEDLATITTLKKKTAAELTIEGENKIDAIVRTDQSGNLLKKTMNRLQLTNPIFSSLGVAGIAMETEDKINKLPSQFVTGLNYLKNAEPVVYERISKNLAEGLPISESQIATITAQGLELEQARLERNFQQGKVTPEEYNKKATEFNTVRKNNVLDNRETLRAFLSDGIAEKGDQLGKIKQSSHTGIPSAAIADYFLGHTWNYSDEQIKYFGEQYAKENSIDPQDARVQEAIKYLQDNEGAMIMQNSIAKAGGIREFFKGAAEPIRGISNAIEDLAKSSNDIYAEGQSQGNVNVSEKRLKAEDTGVRGIVNDVVKGTGQFASQAGIAYLTSGGIGAAGKAVLGRTGTLVVAGDIAAADMTATDLIGSTLLKSKDALATFITSYAQVYDSNLKNALNYTSDNSLAKRAAAINSSIEGATELFLSPLDVAKGIAKQFRSKGTTKELLEILSDKALEKTPDKLTSFLTKTLKGVVGTSEVAAAEIGEEMVTQIADYVTNAYLNPNSETFQNRDLMNELGITAYQTGLSMAVPALMNGIGAANANTFSKGSLLIAGQNRQRLVDDLNENLALKKISQEEYNSKVQLINTAAVANAQLPNKVDNSKLSTNEKADYVFSRVAEAMLANKVKHSKDEAEKNILNTKIKEQQDFRTKMLGGEVEEIKEPTYKVDGNAVSRADLVRIAKGEDSDQFHFEITDDEETKNLLKIIDKEKGIAEAKLEEDQPKDAVQLLNEARDTGKLGVFKDMEDEVALKTIAQQAQNIDDKGKPHPPEQAKMAMESTKNQFGEELVNAAIEKYPAAPVEQKEQEKEPVVSTGVKSKLSALKEKRAANKPVEKTEPVESDELKPIRQLGTGANVYFETEKYRVNDLENGKTVLNISDNAGGLVPMANIEFDDPKEAVRVATELEKVFPKGVPPAILIDKIVEDIKNGKDITKPAHVESELSKKITPAILRELLNEEDVANKTASGTGATKRKAGDYLYNQDRGAFDALLEDIKSGNNKDSWKNLEEIYNKKSESKPTEKQKTKKAKKEEPADEYNPDERPSDDIMSENETLEELAKSEGQTVPIVAGDYPIDFYAQNDEATGKPVFYVQGGDADAATFDNFKEALYHFDNIINDYNDGKVPLVSHEGDFDFETKEQDDIFPEPNKTVNYSTQFKPSSYISQEEAHAIVASWKNLAKEIGEKEDHSNEVIISIFDASGTWSKPYEEAGYTVIRYDLSRGDDVMKENWAKLRADIEASGKVVVGLITAPPCTSFAVSGARWWDSQHDNPSKEWVEKKYGSFAAEYFDRPLDYAIALVDMVKVAVEFLNPTLFHTAENPVGRIQKKADLPNPTFVFNPHNFGDPYTKKTMLWGEMNPDLPTANVDPVEGSKMHKLRGDNAEDKKERSQTPEGFAYAFFVANNTSKISLGDKKPVTKKKSDGKDKQVPKIKAIESKAADAENSNNAEQAAEVIKQIDELVKLTPEQEARELGDKVVDGELIKRQPVINAVIGKPVDILFTKEEKQEANYAVIELSDLQPSHRNGVKNENHFIPEAQPRDRGGLEVLKNEAKKKAESLDPSQLADNNIAYFGSPIVNTRGEVIQGNGRGEAIDYYYNNDKADSKGYNKMLQSKAEDLGLDKKAIAEMKQPVLVRMADVSDEDAIVLGNFTSSDLEDVKQKNAEAKSAIGKLKQAELTKLADTIGGRIGENDTLKGAIRDNAKPIIDLLMDNGVLRADNREQYFNKDGVTPEGIEAAHNVVRQLLFEGGANELAGKFDNLPFFQREAIEKTIPAILSNRELKTNIQTVIEILHDKTESGTASFNTWAKQYDMFKGGKAPVDLYNHANLALAKKIDESKTQKEISTTIKELAALMNGAPETLFDAAKAGLPFQESVAEKNILFAFQEPTSEEVADMVDIIKDLVDEGTLRLKQIQDYVAKELEDNSPELRNLVATAYHEYGKQYTPKQITQGVIGRIGGFLSKLFGGKGAEKIFIAKDAQSLAKKAEELGGEVQYQRSLMDYVKIVATSLALSSTPIQTAKNTTAPIATEVNVGEQQARQAISNLVDAYYAENNETPPADVVDRAVGLWQRFGKPLILPDSTKNNDRAFAQQYDDTTVIGNITNFDDLVAELAHAAQYASKAKLDQRGYSTQEKYDQVEYERKGSMEYDAHKFLEPMIASYILNGEKFTMLPLDKNKIGEGKKAAEKYGLNDIFYMQSPDGKILGFTHNGKIYLNGQTLNPNTSIHEAGHIWTAWAEQNNKEIYDRGVELLVGSRYMAAVTENKFYKDEAAKLPADQRERYFQHEALAMAIGDKGAQFITQAKKNGFKEWLNNLWERIKNAAGFTDITADQLQKLTFDQFAERAAADILRNEDTVEEEETEPTQNASKEAKDNLAAYTMTTSDATNKYLSGKTIENIFGDAPEGNQSYYVQKLSDMLQDGKNMVAIAQGAWGTDISDYGRKLFSYIRKMSMDQELSNKKAVLLATFLGEIKEEISRNEDRRTELTPLYNQVEGYYQGYMNIIGKSAAAGRLLRLYRDKYMGDIFASRILEEQQIREKEELRKAQEDSQRISELVAAEVNRVTAEQKEQQDKEADEKVKKEKKKSEKKGKLSQSEAEQMAADKMEAIKNKGGLTAFVDKIKDAISKINCK